MKYRILVRRLLLRKGRYISGTELKELSKGLELEHKDALAYLFGNKYLKRIVRGFFYIPSAEERRLNTGSPSHFEAIARAMEYKKVKNWYFGLETAIKLNAITHEFFAIDYVVSDTISRARPFKIFGRKVKFVKLNKKLFGFGIKKDWKFPYSDLEKTILDLAHLRIYSGKAEKAIIDELIEWAEESDHKKLLAYSKHYSARVGKIAEELK